MSNSIRGTVLAIAVLLSTNLCVSTGLIGGWERWYSPSAAYRLQTNALLKGHTAISNSPADVLHDFAWAEGGVHQVWGLGIPLLRLPFEAMANAVGQPSFPDRVVLWVVLIPFFICAIRVILRPGDFGSVREWLTALPNHPSRLVAFAVIALFPPVVTLCTGAFNVYEEAVFVGYLAATGTFLGLLSFTHKPQWLLFVALSLFAGLIPLVRVTMGCYGLSSVFIASLLAVRTWGWRWAAAGPACFSLGGAVVYWTNVIRFGSGFEFGHQLNISGGDLTYMSRFGGPYDDEPILSAALELFGCLFGVQRLNGFDCYASDIVTFQSPTIRWRHFYNITFDITYLVMLIALLGWACTLWWRRPSYKQLENFPLGVAAAWFVLCTLPLIGFYLRFHAISSRYIMDFAPAIAGLICAGLLQLEQSTEPRPISHRRYVPTIALIAGLWWAGQIYAGARSSESTALFTQDEILTSMPQMEGDKVCVPKEYNAAMEPTDNSKHLRSWGWNSDGTTQPLVLLFVEDMDCLIIDVEPAVPWPLVDRDYHTIRAKVGLEALDLLDVLPNDKGCRLVFSSPRRASYKKGVQMVYLAMVPTEQILRPRSDFRLKRVGWHKTADANL